MKISHIKGIIKKINEKFGKENVLKTTWGKSTRIPWEDNRLHKKGKVKLASSRHERYFKDTCSKSHNYSK